MNLGAPIFLPDLWDAHRHLASGIDHRPSSAYQSQWKTLRDQFRVAIISAETYYSRGAGDSEIQQLRGLLRGANNFLFEAHEEEWTSTVYQQSRFDQFFSYQARELDRVLLGFGASLGSSLQPTVVLIAEARIEDVRWIGHAFSRIGQASPAPGLFAQAYHEKNNAQLDNMMTQVLNEQTRFLSSTDLSPDEAKNAVELTNSIMNLTGKRPAPGVFLGQRFVGPFEHHTATARHDLYLSRFVTTETVMIKALRQNIAGKDDESQTRRFHKYTETWHSLRCDYTLPFYGIGKGEISGQTVIYSVAPYLSEGDAVNYHKRHQVSAARSLQITYDAARGLRYLHEKDPSIVHFGVRPDNILINDKGEGVLAGFGLIEAPEHLSSPFTRKTSADVWAWGMVALELVGGKKPFCDVSDFLAGTHASQGQRPKRERYPRVDEIKDGNALWQLLEECWAQEETKRPNMNDVVSRLGKLNQANKDDKSLPSRGDPPTTDQPLSDGRADHPVAQVQPRRR